MIYTLDYLEKSVAQIVGYWNGKDDKFIDGDGEARTEDDVYAAQEIKYKLDEIRTLVKELGI